MKDFLIVAGIEIAKVALVILCVLTFIQAMEWMYGLKVLDINGEDGWKPVVGKLLLMFSLLGFYEYCKWTDRK
ncbi:hypothetical protein [Pseudomonas phage D6]|nr:hypothetical protein [Pseudomonas phage D6]